MFFAAEKEAKLASEHPVASLTPRTEEMDDFQQKIAKLQNNVEEIMDKIDKTKIQPLQKASLLKMAACVDLTSRPQIDQCMQKNQVSMATAQNIINQETQQFQQRLERCMMDCQDSVRDKNFKSEDSMNNAYYACATTCVDKTIGMLKTLQGRIEKEIDAKTK